MAADDLGILFEKGSPGLPALLHAMANDESIAVRRQVEDVLERFREKGY
ncbi:MAG: hypothetical protein ACYTG5_13755 [Planctomycetota bacterium]|jgi:hypothetical protein